MTNGSKSSSSFHLHCLQFVSALFVGFFAVKHVLMTGEANRMFFHQSAASDVPPTTHQRHVWLENYYELAERGELGSSLAETIEPLQLMRDYIQSHSQQALERDCLSDGSANHCRERKFVLGFYQCRHNPGLRMHSFMNALVWAVVTNRTLLWHYHDGNTTTTNTCTENTTTCNNYTQHMCDSKFLRLRRWLPSFSEWQSRLDLPLSPVRADGIHERDFWARPYDRPESPPLIWVGDQPTLATGVDLTRPYQRMKLLEEEASRERAKRLFFYGYYFTYGMFQEALFTFRGTKPASGENVSVDGKTFGLHSRHPRHEHERGYDFLENVCIQQLNSTKVKPHSTHCTVFLMADKLKRYGKLERSIRMNAGCDVKFIPHTDISDKAYFKDWVFIRDNVRDGFLAPHRRKRGGIGMRPSSALLREAVEFRRVLEQKGNTTRATMMHECHVTSDWAGSDGNCTRIDRLAASFGIERFQQMYGFIQDPCSWR